jgi:D-threo-aldose 1-dehydrogenase
MIARERARLGRTTLEVTRLGLGTAPLGGLYEPVADRTAHEVVQSACDLGLRLFDTAPLYGSGLAERRAGHVLQTRLREDFVLSTKVGRLLEPGRPDAQFKGALPASPVFDFSYEAAMRSLDESLQRLGLDRVDIVLIHDPDDHFEEAIGGAYRALERLRGEGAIGAIGVGMNQAELLCRFAREGDFDCFLVAGRYTLLDTSALTELLPLCEERGIAVIAGGVFNSGVLAGGETFDYTAAAPEIRQRTDRLRRICERWSIPLGAAAVQFPLGHPAVAAVVVGCRTPEELREDVRLFELDVPQALWEELTASGLVPEEASPP